MARNPLDDLAAERETFRRLQRSFKDQFVRIFADPSQERTVLVVSSLSVDQKVLSTVTAAIHYEERLLCLLLLLKLPRTRVIYVSSAPISDDIVEYFLQLGLGAEPSGARDRLTMLDCADVSPRSLTEKILERPEMIERIETALGDRTRAHMTCFNVTDLERRLAVRLGVPIYGCDPDLLGYGSKSGSRRAFREAGVVFPDGAEDLNGEDDLVEALADLKARSPGLRKAVVKLNEGFSGEGNALFSFAGAPSDRSGLARWVRDRLPDLACEASERDWESFRSQLEEMGGIVEVFVEGRIKRSPSAQLRVDPLGAVDPISTHDQILGGRSGQVFLGSEFPADPAYRKDIQDQAMKVAGVLAQRGVLGRFGVDFISVRDRDDPWRHYAIEINLRKGGTTHPYVMLEQLTGGRYDRETASFQTPALGRRCYYETDNLQEALYRGITPGELLKIAGDIGVLFDPSTAKGLVLHLIGAVTHFGKFGAQCIAETPDEARELYHSAVARLNQAIRARDESISETDLPN